MAATTDVSWTRWLTARTVSFPTHARDALERCLYRSNATGSTQLYAWDRDRGRSRRLTDREHGTVVGDISPDGRWVWWFDDTDGDEQGQWKRQPFDVDADHRAEPVAPELPAGAGLSLALGVNTAVFGLSRDDGTTLYRWTEDGTTAVLFNSDTLAWASTLSYDESLVAVTHTETERPGDTFSTAVRVVDASTAVTVAELADGPGYRLEASAFAARPGDRRLLVHHQRTGARAPLVWNIDDGTEHHPELGLDGEASARWCPDASALLVKVHRQARDRLLRYDLETRTPTNIPTPPGSVAGFAARPDGSVEFEFSSAAAPPTLRTDGGGVFLPQPDEPPPSVHMTDAWVPGPGGSIHTLVTRASDRPSPTVFLLHGGPGDRVDDAFWPLRAALVQEGYAVVHVNYRGSSGYGTAWEQANRPRPGLVELEDVAAARQWAVEAGVALPGGCVLAGISWGGYLTLLGLGTQPELWSAGIADVPIGDLLALYEDEMEPVREYDRSLFGGSPDELPEKWARSSPLEYADRVRAPVLVIAGRNDVRCPFRQVRNYLDRLDELGTPYKLDEFDAGHIRLVHDEQVRQIERQLDFLRRQVPSPARLQ